MRQAWIPLLAAMFCTIPAAAQTTKPPADLAKENAELRAYAEQLEARIAELEAKLKVQQKPVPRGEVRPFTIPPHTFQSPQPPRPAPAVPSPRPHGEFHLTPSPDRGVPDSWQK